MAPDNWEFSKFLKKKKPLLLLDCYLFTWVIYKLTHNSLKKTLEKKALNAIVLF